MNTDAKKILGEWSVLIYQREIVTEDNYDAMTALGLIHGRPFRWEQTLYVLYKHQLYAPRNSELAGAEIILTGIAQYVAPEIFATLNGAYVTAHDTYHVPFWTLSPQPNEFGERRCAGLTAMLKQFYILPQGTRFLIAQRVIYEEEKIAYFTAKQNHDQKEAEELKQYEDTVRARIRQNMVSPVITTDIPPYTPFKTNENNAAQTAVSVCLCFLVVFIIWLIAIS